MLYSSNFATYITPKEKGWYIQWHNISGDKDFIGPYPVIKDNIHALELLQEANPDDFPDGASCASVLFFTEIK